MAKLILAKNIQKQRNIIVVLCIGFLSLTTILLPNISYAFETLTLEITGIDEPFNILSLGQNLTTTATVLNQMRSTRLTDISDLVFDIAFDERFPILFLWCAVGNRITAATISIDGIYSIKLSNILISSIYWKDNMLQIGLDFGTIEWVSPDYTTGWDRLRGRSIE